MGVRCLETFMKKDVPNGYVPVSLEKEIKLFHNLHNIQPILLIDLLSLSSLFNRNKMEILCGGRQNTYEMMLDDLFIKLKETGAELVFFGDGPTTTTKYDTYVKRQDQQYERSATLHDLIYKGCSLEYIVQKHESTNGNLINNSGFQTILEKCARKHGTYTISFNVECDTEMAEYASKTPAVLAIMADDSDFLIYSGKWRYFSLKNLDCDSLMTMEYSRLELRNFLQLSDIQMVVLSTLGGNDVMQYENVMSFHSRISGPKAWNRFMQIAKFIKRSLPEKYDDELVFEIGKLVLRDTSPEALDCIHRSMTFYDPKFQKQEFETDELLNKCLEKQLVFIYSVLKEMPINYSLPHYDLRQDDFPLYFDIAIPLAQRQFGVLLQHKQQQSDFIFYKPIFTKRSHNESTCLHFIAPIYPPVMTPPLMELMFEKEDCNEHLNDLRFNVLKWLLCWDRLESLDLKTIPKEYLLDILVLVLLKNYGIITTLESDIILFTLKSAKLNLCPKEIQYPEVINSKAFRIAFIFLKMHSHVTRCFQIVGLRSYVVRFVTFIIL
ncbi:unnamed protein product [Diamesa serratosioi]